VTTMPLLDLFWAGLYFFLPIVWFWSSMAVGNGDRNRRRRPDHPVGGPDRVLHLTAIPCGDTQLDRRGDPSADRDRRGSRMTPWTTDIW
jgi:hypothetical protein